MIEQIIIFFQIVFIDLVLAGDNAIIIGMVASRFDNNSRKKIIFWGVAAAIILRIIFTLITAYLLQINGLKFIGGLLLLYIAYKLYKDVIQNKVLMDGMIIYSPFHSIGLFSVFDTDIIRNTDVYTGGFSAEYGGRISSIMDIKTIDGNKKELGGRLSANTFGSKIFIEGPLSKNEKSSFVFSGKTSYLDKS